MDFHRFYQNIESVQRDFARTKFNFNCFAEDLSALSTIKSESFTCIEVGKEEIVYPLMTEFKNEDCQEFDDNSFSEAERNLTEYDGLAEENSIDNEAGQFILVNNQQDCGWVG